jgi:hypothetical protein
LDTDSREVGKSDENKRHPVDGTPLPEEEWLTENGRAELFFTTRWALSFD